MNRQDALELIHKALDATTPGLSAKVSETSDLINDNLLDSLDSMNFLFELETLHGAKLVAIDESFNDFRVATLIDILVAA